MRGKPAGGECAARAWRRAKPRPTPEGSFQIDVPPGEYEVVTSKRRLRGACNRQGQVDANASLIVEADLLPRSALGKTPARVRP